jgi:hypothetical protein
MMLTRRIQTLTAFLILAALTLSACGPSNAGLTPTVDTNAIRTEAVATYAFLLTETALAVPTATLTSTPMPTDTPVPTSATIVTQKPQATCYGLLWIADESIPDNTPMAAGQKFTKTWSVQNIGSCAWAPGFTLNWFGGDAMNGQTYTLSEAVPIGAKKEISVDMVAPSGKTGVITGTWKMADANGSYFGDALFVIIVIGGTSTGTPSAVTPTATP